MAPYLTIFNYKMIKANSLGTEILRWPYPVRYQEKTEVQADLLVIGGGLAGSFAAIEAAKAGTQVAIVDKASLISSGDGGAGIDHWVNCFSSPSSNVTPEAYMELPGGHNFMGHTTYIATKGAYDALLELEKMGLAVKDDGTFQNSPFYDKETGLLRCYDYTSTVSYKLRGGHNIKRVLNKALLKQENISRYERVMITSLLSKEGRQGEKVCGAIGFSLTTGELIVFQAKAVLLTTGGVTGTWIFNTELCGNSFRNDPNNTGDGLAMAFRAGAELVEMQRGGSTHGGHPFSWPRYGTGTCDNTWFPCTLVDNRGKKIPWVDYEGRPIADYADRTKPVAGQPYINTCMDRTDKIHKPTIIFDLPEKIRNGEYELPLWADLSDLPEAERRSVWGLMIGNEGKTRYPVYDYYNRSGFHPDKDMLQVPIMGIDSYYNNALDWFHGEPDTVRQWRTEDFGGSGYAAVDWNLMTNVEGLFCAGQICGLTGAAYACSSGRYAGRRAAEYAHTTEFEALPQNQIAAETRRIYAPVKRAENAEGYVSWKELWAGISRVMQCCFSDNKLPSVVSFGIDWMDNLKENEMQASFARNPHELARVLECESRAEVGTIYMKAHLEMCRQKSTGSLAEDHILMIFDRNGKTQASIKENRFWLKAPYKGSYLENYLEIMKHRKTGQGLLKDDNRDEQVFDTNPISRVESGSISESVSNYFSECDPSEGSV